MTEFELIRRFFATQPIARRDVALGIGDDAAVVDTPPGRQLVITTDMLVAGVHFFPEADPVALGHKALAVNLSDLAAMGAEPVCFTLALALPRVDGDWLAQFCEGVYGLARQHDLQLVGGDTTRGPLTISITAHGWVPAGQAITRSAARVGDRIYVTGELGDAGLALWEEQGKIHLSETDSAAVIERLTRPMPRVNVGQRLRGLAHSAIDISDGLAADLGHILERSGVGARVDLAQLPLSDIYRAQLPQIGWELALANGDDYELCFTVPPETAGRVQALAPSLGCRVTCIGEIIAGSSLRFVDIDGRPYDLKQFGHDHFGPS